MPEFQYVVNITCETRKQAETVIGEHLAAKEDYGFDYRMSREELDPFIEVEGGIVQNNPALPVFDFDHFPEDFDVDRCLHYLDTIASAGLQDRMGNRPQDLVDQVLRRGNRQDIETLAAMDVAVQNVPVPAALADAAEGKITEPYAELVRRIVTEVGRNEAGFPGLVCRLQPATGQESERVLIGAAGEEEAPEAGARRLPVEAVGLWSRQLSVLNPVHRIVFDLLQCYALCRVESEAQVL